MLLLTIGTALVLAVRYVRGRTWKALALASSLGVGIGILVHLRRRQQRVNTFLVTNTGNILLDKGVAAYDAGVIEDALHIFTRLSEGGQPGIAAKALVNRALILQTIGDTRAEGELRHALSTSTGVPEAIIDELTENEQAIITTLAARGRMEMSELVIATLVPMSEIDRTAPRLIELALVEPSRGPTGRRYLALTTTETATAT